MSRAISGRYNLIQDCSGVPADPHIKFINFLKNRGYKTTAYATTSTIYAEDLNKVGAITRAQWRYKKTNRWVPTSVIRDKHVEVSKEAPKFFDKVDKFVLNDNSGANGQDFTILETFNVSKLLAEKLKLSKEAGLFQLFYENWLSPTKPGEGTRFWIKKDGFLKSPGVEIIEMEKGSFMAVVIYDQEAYKSFSDKAKYNKSARDPLELVRSVTIPSRSYL